MSDPSETGEAEGTNGAPEPSGNGDAPSVGDGLRLLSLSMENIGPFDRADIEFATGRDGGPAVTILTGENGTGKTIVLDAIRGMFGPDYAKLERSIQRGNSPFTVSLEYADEGARRLLHSMSMTQERILEVRLGTGARFPLGLLPSSVQRGLTKPPGWVVSYWRSSLAVDEFGIHAISTPQHKGYLLGSLQGHYKNQDVTALLCHFDYLRDSRDPRERASGEAVYEAASRIVSASLLEGGELAYVRRSDLTPIVRQAGQEVPLENISSGNAYLVQHMIDLLGKIFSVHVLLNTDPSELCKTPGVLLIDEAENHLHPRWQKRFLRTLLDLFPNLQIIATTHSPFIVSSIPGARVYVCRYERGEGRCTITDETADYANKPVEEILASEAFDGTRPFNEEITRLLEQRDRAIDTGDEAERRHIERELLARNPLYFRYFEVEERLLALARGPS
jgi:AAA domain, putative AbiEii toxin, Type IV TA system